MLKTWRLQWPWLFAGTNYKNLKGPEKLKICFQGKRSGFLLYKHICGVRHTMIFEGCLNWSSHWKDCATCKTWLGTTPESAALGLLGYTEWTKHYTALYWRPGMHLLRRGSIVFLLWRRAISLDAKVRMMQKRTDMANKKFEQTVVCLKREEVARGKISNGEYSHLDQRFSAYSSLWHIDLKALPLPWWGLHDFPLL